MLAAPARLARRNSTQRRQGAKTQSDFKPRRLTRRDHRPATWLIAEKCLSPLRPCALCNAISQHRHISRRFLTQRTQRLAQRDAEVGFLCGLCENLCVLCVYSGCFAVWLRLRRSASSAFNQSACFPISTFCFLLSISRTRTRRRTKPIHSDAAAF